jgi:hypothetical protein
MADTKSTKSEPVYDGTLGRTSSDEKEWAEDPRIDGRTGRSDETLKVTCRAESATYDVGQLVSKLGGVAKSTKGRVVTVGLPAEGWRNPSDKRQKIAEGLANDPNVESVETS